MRVSDERDVFVILGLILLGMMTDDNKSGAAPPAMRQWEPLAGPQSDARGIPPRFTLQWIAMESGGNPCAIGNPREQGPDGYPREMGLAQSYNPDDLQAAGVKSEQIRDYCVPGTDNPTSYRGQTVRGFSGKVRRPLTPAEMEQAIAVAVATIAAASDAASRIMQQAGAQWSERDYWTFCKLRHNMPGLARGLIAVARGLGRAPATWAEFREHVMAVVFDQATEAHRADFPHELDVAERAGQVV